MKTLLIIIAALITFPAQAETASHLTCNDLEGIVLQTSTLEFGSDSMSIITFELLTRDDKFDIHLTYNYNGQTMSNYVTDEASLMMVNNTPDLITFLAVYDGGAIVETYKFINTDGLWELILSKTMMTQSKLSSENTIMIGGCVR